MLTFAKNAPPRRYMLCDALADSIRERLFEHVFTPRVPLDESALTAHYRTGRQALTAALEQLVHERLLTVREDGGYCVAEYCRADIEDILAALEQLRCSMLRRQTNGVSSASGAEAVVAASPYWGSAGFVVAHPFTTAARSLYAQLRVGIGPELAAIEAQCADEGHAALKRATASGKPEHIESCCAETAQVFRQRVLTAFDGLCAQRA
ncbi:MAG: GntR family transcriptional regulator [Zoogloeaceae bacterium]|nr:GntR family transcriptional regulator [Zoogloeaceae bacterium]